MPDENPEEGTAHVSWPGGRTIKVHQLRCNACGSVEVVRRRWMEDHENDPTIRGQAKAGDGRIFVARPLTDD